MSRLDRPTFAAAAARHLGYGTDPAGDAARREAMAHATITPEQLRQLRETGRLPGERPVEDPDPVPGHHLDHNRGASGTHVTCECGRWEGWYNGPRSRRRVLDDYAAHTAAELSAEGPIKVVAVRLDQEELEP